MDLGETAATGPRWTKLAEPPEQRRQLHGDGRKHREQLAGGGDDPDAAATGGTATGTAAATTIDTTTIAAATTNATTIDTGAAAATATKTAEAFVLEQVLPKQKTTQPRKSGEYRIGAATQCHKKNGSVQYNRRPCRQGRGLFRSSRRNQSRDGTPLDWGWVRHNTGLRAGCRRNVPNGCSIRCDARGPYRRERAFSCNKTAIVNIAVHPRAQHPR
mmetsp:Transcript_29945/g.62595  ORF Transcript_29945/g.62595 Transcript_29945/m.62595 type:complete len:216 (-) Transcript_29945:579-1226(-)